MFTLGPHSYKERDDQAMICSSSLSGPHKGSFHQLNFLSLILSPCLSCNLRSQSENTHLTSPAKSGSSELSFFSFFLPTFMACFITSFCSRSFCF